MIEPLGQAWLGPAGGLVAWLFVRLLSLVYLTAFASLALQVIGLIGQDGLLPAAGYLQAARSSLGRAAYLRLPTLFWLQASDAALRLACLAGVAGSIALLAGLAPRLLLVVLFVLYLSLVQVGQVFLAYQWDALLLEAGFLAIFLGLGPVVIWLFRWLLFRLMFLSGAAKLLSRDLSWRDLTALRYHYETQPLPTPPAWYAHWLPLPFHKFSAAVMFVIELIVPFLLLGTEPLRLLAGLSMFALQLLILLSGNYTFFNLLTMSLCVFMLDDAQLRPWLGALGVTAGAAPGPAAQVVTGLLAVAIVLLSGAQLYARLAGELPERFSRLLAWVAPLRIVNTYGLFALMTKARPEIVLEGSNDAKSWTAYEFIYKPGNVKRRLPWVAPHQPRLDWQMWFAAQGAYYMNPWFTALVARLLLGSRPVERLLARNPFASAPPRYLRALLYDYHYADPALRRATGAIWRRELIGIYMPPATIGAQTSTQGGSQAAESTG